MSVASLSVNYSSQSNYYQSNDTSGKAIIVEKTLDLEINYNDKSTLESPNLSKALSISSQKIISKINEILEAKNFKKIQDLKPQDVSPEKTADRVVTGITALFNAFAKQNKDLSNEDLVAKFIEQAKKGVEQGYSDAKNILQDLGAFEFEGVESSISETKDLIMQKLDKFAEFKLEQLNKSVEEQSAELTESELLNQVANY